MPHAQVPILGKVDRLVRMSHKLILTRAVAMLQQNAPAPYRDPNANPVHGCSMHDCGRYVDARMADVEKFITIRHTAWKLRPNGWRSRFRAMITDVKDAVRRASTCPCKACHECVTRTGNGFANMEAESRFLELQQESRM